MSGRSTFYQRVLQTLERHRVRFVIGGAFAFTHYCGLRRQTKDLDLFIREDDWEAAAIALGAAGVDAHLSFPHWYGRAVHGVHIVDLVFGSGNGVVRVDEAWMARAPRLELLQSSVRVCPPEELIWFKSFVMERERFDGADVQHLLLALGRTLDWRHLQARFGANWRVLLAHLVLFGFVYPGQTNAVPDDVQGQLLDRLRAEGPVAADRMLCRGTLLSRSQYLVDVERWGFSDARNGQVERPRPGVAPGSTRAGSVPATASETEGQSGSHDAPPLAMAAGPHGSR